MPPERILNWPEVTGILARLGLEQIYSAGEHAVYADSRDRRVVIHFTRQWDMLFDDLARHLSAIGISRTEVEAALESLYSDH